MTRIKGKKILLPVGFSDTLYPKSLKRSLIVDKILNIFSDYSYLRVNPPIIEFEETLLSEGPGSVLKDNTFRIMDPVSKKMMALRSDMTTQISRISSSRMAHYPRPLRISYSGEVLRVKSTTLNMNRQITQVGAEIVGKMNSDLEAEIILIGLKILKKLNVKNLCLDLNFPILINNYLKNLSSIKSKNISKAIEKKDLNYLKRNKFSNQLEIINLLESSGNFENSVDYLNLLSGKNKKNKDINYLVNVAEKIKRNIEGVRVIIDPLEVNSFNYHDGMTFTIFAKGIRGEIAKGGSYKTMNDENATGISIYTEVIDNIPDLFLKKKTILLSSLDFVNANKFINQGYKVVFSNEKNDKKFIKIAELLKCDYVFLKEKLKKLLKKETYG